MPHPKNFNQPISGLVTPRFGGIATFMRLPHVPLEDAAGLDIGIVGLYPPGAPEAVEVRAFAPGAGVVEDPVTGSLNAGIAQWLVGSRLNPSYVASQGTVLGRRGRIHVTVEGGTGPSGESGGVVWVGGDTRTVITGTVAL